MIEYWIKYTAFSSYVKKVVFIFPAVGMFTVAPRKEYVPCVLINLNPSSTRVDSISVLAKNPSAVEGDKMSYSDR
jgi:hypothetical protein